jgi:digeranylgeranylglycerophospholipid reductase
VDLDVLIVGAGPTGCVIARDLARAGWRVALCDAAQRDRLGRQVIIEVEDAAFARAGLDVPSEEEVPYHGRNARILVGSGREAFVVRGGVPATSLYLDRFARKLAGLAEDAGATFLGGHKATGALTRGGAIVGAAFDTSEGRVEIHSRIVVDATGFDAALLHSLDPDLGMASRDDPRDEVVAATRLSTIDPTRAAAAVEAGLQGDEEIWATVGRLGCYSTEFRHLSLRSGTGYVLVGVKADQAKEIPAALSQHMALLGGVGAPLHAGGGRIRVRHTRHRLVADGFLLAGESARMVIPMNGSGVASGLTAAASASRVMDAALRAGDVSTHALWPYAAQWQRGRGARLAALDRVRVGYEALPEGSSDALFDGFGGPEDAVAANAGELPPLRPGTLLRRGRGLLRYPTLIPAMARIGVGTTAVLAHHRRFPKTWDPDRFARWSRRSTQLLAYPGSSQGGGY